MKKSNVKKLISIAGLTAMCCTVSPTMPVEAIGARALPDNDVVLPNYVAITRVYNYLGMETDGQLLCIGETDVQNRYNTGVKMELQQYDGGWDTIKTWTDTGTKSVSLEKYYSVASGYSYRLKLTHYSYDSNWNQLEAITKYSSTVSY